jgi:hypothetical protein
VAVKFIVKLGIRNLQLHHFLRHLGGGSRATAALAAEDRAAASKSPEEKVSAAEIVSATAKLYVHLEEDFFCQPENPSFQRPSTTAEAAIVDGCGSSGSVSNCRGSYDRISKKLSKI